MAVATLFAAGCVGGNDDNAAGGGGNGDDNQVEVLAALGNTSTQGFRDAVADFAKTSGITIKLTDAGQSFDTAIRTRAGGNDYPDIALFPQPGLLLDVAKRGKGQDLTGMVDLDKVRSTLVPGILDTAVSDGKIYGVPIGMDVKSIVWYPKKAFEAKGYRVPTTIAELEALTQQIKSDGTTPWCVGLESGAATGWPATDWLEDFVLRYGGPETYDKWVSHQIPFNDPTVVKAASEFEKLALADGNVFGGRKGVVATQVDAAPLPMFQNPPKCFLHKQASFIYGSFPKAVQAAGTQDVGVFQLPGTTADSRPIMGGGTLAGAYNTNESTKKVLQFLSSPEFKGWGGGYLSPHKTYDLEQYPDQITKDIAKLAYSSSVFRFDGSDSMPGAVGAGSFWKEMVAWISGQQNLDTALSDIQKSWPS